MLGFGNSMFLPREVATIGGALGMVLLAVSWHRRNRPGVSRPAQIGWMLVGIYFFNDVSYYLQIDDVVLAVMTALALPIDLSIAVPIACLAGWLVVTTVSGALVIGGWLALWPWPWPRPRSP